MDDKINYTTINHIAREKLGLTWIEYGLADLIHNLSNNPQSASRWCYASKETLGTTLGVTRQYVQKMLLKLEQLGLIERHLETRHVRTTQLWFDTVIIKKANSQVSLHTVNKVDTDGQQSLHPSTLNDSKQSLHNNNIYNNNNHKEELEGFISAFNEKMNTRYRFTDELYKKYSVRIKTFSLEDLLLALDNMLKLPFYRGENDRKWRASPEYILRNDENVQRFLNSKVGDKPEFDPNDPGKTFMDARKLDELRRNKQI